jgi:hypothetical protein
VSVPRARLLMKTWETPAAPRMDLDALARMRRIRVRLGDGPIGQHLLPGMP